MAIGPSGRNIPARSPHPATLEIPITTCRCVVGIVFGLFGTTPLTNGNIEGELRKCCCCRYQGGATIAPSPGIAWHRLAFA